MFISLNLNLPHILFRIILNKNKLFFIRKQDEVKFIIKNEEKIKILTEYINSKNELYKALLKLRKKETDQESSEV